MPTKLEQATARRQMWEQRWTAANKPIKGVLWTSYRRASDAEMAVVVAEIRAREAALHVGHEHRKSLSIDHETYCPVYSEGLTNDKCTCHYSDANCSEW